MSLNRHFLFSHLLNKKVRTGPFLTFFIFHHIIIIAVFSVHYVLCVHSVLAVHMQVYGVLIHSRMADVFFCCSPSYCPNPGSFLKLEAHLSARLAGHWVLGICLTLLSTPESISACCHVCLFIGDAGDLSSGPQAYKISAFVYWVLVPFPLLRMLMIYFLIAS